MNTGKALRQFEDTANLYIRELDNFSLEQLHRKAGEDEWSLGQMYRHLIDSALHMHLRNIERCLTPDEDATASQANKTSDGEAIFEQGSFPPVRIQVPPSPQYTPAQPDTKDQLVEGLNAVIRRMQEIEPRLEQAQTRHTVAHPRFGGLHAQEWFVLIDMHYRHHLRQLERLKGQLERNA